MNIDKIALQRCIELLRLAKEAWKTDEKLSKRYVLLCRKLAMRHRLKLGRRKFCKKCNAVFIAGDTLVVRTSARELAVIWKCKACSSVLRFPIRKS